MVGGGLAPNGSGIDEREGGGGGGGEGEEDDSDAGEGGGEGGRSCGSVKIQGGQALQSPPSRSTPSPSSRPRLYKDSIEALQRALNAAAMDTGSL